MHGSITVFVPNTGPASGAFIDFTSNVGKSRALVEYEGKTYIRPYSKDLNDASRKWSADDKRFLNPISKNVMLINPNITQNPGW